LKKDKPFKWETLQTNAFNTFRESLCTEPILQYPDFTQPFILTTDASGYAIGGVLSQGKIRKDLTISYVSRMLNKAEQNYSTIEKECLAITYYESLQTLPLWEEIYYYHGPQTFSVASLD